MIFLKSIELTNFKGVSKLSCDFDDLTVLAGLNNSGKTTILQGIYLVFAALPRVAEHAHVFHAKSEICTISLQTALSPLGLPDTTWLMSFFQPEVTGSIIGLFENGISLELGILRNSPHSFVFKHRHHFRRQLSSLIATVDSRGQLFKELYVLLERSGKEL